MRLLLIFLLLSCISLVATERVLILKDGTKRSFVSCEITNEGRYKITFADGSFRTYAMDEASIRMVSSTDDSNTHHTSHPKPAPVVAKKQHQKKATPLVIWKHQIRPGQRLPPGTIIKYWFRGKIRTERVISDTGGRRVVAKS